MQDTQDKRVSLTIFLVIIGVLLVAAVAIVLMCSATMMFAVVRASAPPPTYDPYVYEEATPIYDEWDPPVPVDPTAQTPLTNPFLTVDRMAKFYGQESTGKDYEAAVEALVGNSDHRTGGPILERLGSASPNTTYQEELQLLAIIQQIHEGHPAEAQDALTAWRTAYPYSGLAGYAMVVEGMALATRARTSAGSSPSPKEEARKQYEQAIAHLDDARYQYSHEPFTVGEALFQQAVVYKTMEEHGQALEAYDRLTHNHLNHPRAAMGAYQSGTLAWQIESHWRAKRSFQLLVDNWPDHAKFKTASKNVQALDTIGKPAPELVVDHWIGTPTSLADHRGDVVLLLFWNEWCDHCHKHVPRLQDWQDRYGKDGLVALGVTKHTREQTDEKVQAFLDEQGASYPIAVEPSPYQTTTDHGVYGVPTLAVVGREGRVVWRNHPLRLTDERIEELLTAEPGETEGVDLVTRFMATMMDRSNMPSDESFLAPWRVAELKQRYGTIMLNRYTVVEWEITRLELPIIEVRIKHMADGPWARVLVFKVEQVDGEYYLVPSTLRDSYVDPWWDTSTM